MYESKLNLIELQNIFQEIGKTVTSPVEIFAVGGYCLLKYKGREYTVDVDFIPFKNEFLVPKEYQDIINSDVSRIADLYLSPKSLVEYIGETEEYGHLKVHLADMDLIFAMKVIARADREVERDDIDFKFLHPKINRTRAYKAYCMVSQTNPSFEDWSQDLEIDAWLLANDDPFADSDAFA